MLIIAGEAAFYIVDFMEMMKVDSFNMNKHCG